MSVDLNVLNHLGINLYSNVPAVLSEAVANAWDADATKVNIIIDNDQSSIVIEDDGHGMSVSDINQKFLNVGYQRREAGEKTTPRFGRPVMGRKGIGKLSLFSVADTIEVQSKKRGQMTNGFTMNLPDIQIDIKEKKGTYNPKPVKKAELGNRIGTRITLRDFRKSIGKAEKSLRMRLARRFSIIGSKNNFSITVNSISVTPKDRNYYHKLEYVWYYGAEGKKISKSFNKSKLI